MDTIKAGEESLAASEQTFSHGSAISALNQLMADLKRLRARSSADAWQGFIERCREHNYPILERIRRSPLSGRAFRKPRGYAGDAETLDYIYGEGIDDSSWSEDARRVYAWEQQAPAARSVRARRDLLAERIDHLTGARPGLRALSVACGHLREAQYSRAVREGRIGRLIALDQDEDSLRLVAKNHPSEVVETVQASVKHLLGRQLRFGGLDLCYSAGLYDYLQGPLARALTHALFSRLDEGGRLIIVNFAPELPDIGFMEIAMDWSLIYRDESAMFDLAREIPRDEIDEVQVTRDESKNLVVLELVRA